MDSISVSKQAVAGQTGDQLRRLYSRESFRAILARRAEWEVRAALEEGNIPACHVQEAGEWLEEKAAEFRRTRQGHQH